MSVIGMNSDVDIGITDVDVGCRISPTLRSMWMPTYADPKVDRSDLIVASTVVDNH
jgi:hypothetical protein